MLLQLVIYLLIYKTSNAVFATYSPRASDYTTFFCVCHYKEKIFLEYLCFMLRDLCFAASAFVNYATNRKKCVFTYPAASANMILRYEIFEGIFLDTTLNILQGKYLNAQSTTGSQGRNAYAGHRKFSRTSGACNGVGF